MTNKLYIERQTDTGAILAVDHGGKHWTINVTIDGDDDGGIAAEIGRDYVLCTSTEFRLARDARERGRGRGLLIKQEASRAWRVTPFCRHRRQPVFRILRGAGDRTGRGQRLW